MQRNNSKNDADAAPNPERIDDIHKQRQNRIQKVALDFYDQVLRNDEFLRQSCQDRNRFTEEYSTWKEGEARKRRNMRGTSPATILQVLKADLKLVDAVADGDVIIWTQKPVSGKNNAIKLNRKDRIKDVISRVKHGRKQLEKNRNGLEIDPITFGLNFDNGDISALQTELIQTVSVHNKSNETIVVIVKDQAAFKRGVTTIMPLGVKSKSFQLRSNEFTTITVSYIPQFTGIMKTILSFEISSRQMAPFVIVRYIQVRGGNVDDYNILKPVAPYQKKEKIERGAFSNPERMDEDERNASNIKSDKRMKGLGSHKMSRAIRGSIENDCISDDLINFFYGRQKVPDEIPSDLMHLLNIHNYKGVFQRLLWTEEYQMEIDIKSYDMVKVPLHRVGKFYSIYVPGLAESRPSVLRGDIIKIKFDGKCFEGIVERTEEENALVLFPKKVNGHYTNGMKVDVRFSFKRTALKLCHDALCAVKATENKLKLFRNILFPGHGKMQARTPLNTRTAPNQIRWINRNLNDEQRIAVQEILKAVYRPAPYILFGPPGTGQ